MQKSLVVSGLALAALGAAALGGCALPKPAESAPPDSQVTFTPHQRATPVDPGVADLEATLNRIDQQKLQAAAERKLAAENPATLPANTLPANPDAGASIFPTHVESPSSLHISGIPSIAPDSNPDAAAASQPASAMAAMKTENDTAAVTPPSTPSATQPATILGSPVAPAAAPANDMSVDSAMSIVRKHVAEHPTLGTQLALALLDSADGKPPETAGKGLSEPDQQLLTDLLSALQATASSTGTTLGARAEPLVAMAKKWESAADLAIPRIALASRVDSFGVFTPVDPKFSQGAKHTVIIYCEVANFASKPIDGGWYETHLTQQETLITEDKLLVWRPNPEDVVDRSMNQRHDFYLVKKFTLPDNLAVGKYALRMSVTDAASGKAASKAIEIEITDK